MRNKTQHRIRELKIMNVQKGISIKKGRVTSKFGVSYSLFDIEALYSGSRLLSSMLYYLIFGMVSNFAKNLLENGISQNWKIISQVRPKFQFSLFP